MNWRDNPPHWDIEISRPYYADWMQAGFHGMGWEKPQSYFAHRLSRDPDQEELCVIAHLGGQYIGHAFLVWQPGYPYFQQNAIPETQDLNVLPAYRRQGVASRILDLIEALIAARGHRFAGIGVGLHADYGAAQRLYVHRGYVPDGQGVACSNRIVRPGEMVRLDDDLILHLVKRLPGLEST